MGAQARSKTASLTSSERARVITVVTKLGLKRSARALRVGSATLDDAMNGDPLATETRNRLIASLAAVETDLEDGHGV